MLPERHHASSSCSASGSHGRPAIVAGRDGVVGGRAPVGAIEPGGWIVGILWRCVVVALALWLVRNAGDVVGGATIPMRVLPVVAIALLAAAWWLSGYAHVLGASVPIGGALLLTGDVVGGRTCIVAAILTHVAAVAFLLLRTADALQEIDPKETPERWRSVALVLAPIFLWWITVGGAGVWDMAGHPVPTASATSSGLAGGVILVLLAASSPRSRAGSRCGSRPPLRRRRPWPSWRARCRRRDARPSAVPSPSSLRRPNASRRSSTRRASWVRRAARPGARVPRRRAQSRGRARRRTRLDDRHHAVRSTRRALSGTVLMALAGGGGIVSVVLARGTWWALATFLH
jgi:hypothetical protein